MEEDIYGYEDSAPPHSSLLHPLPPSPHLTSSCSNGTSYQIQPEGKKRRGQGQRRVPTSMVVSLTMIMMCIVMGTPLSLLLTIPAYILADRAEVLINRGEITRAKTLIRWSYALNGGAIIFGVCSVFLFVFLYVVTVSNIKGGGARN